MPVATFMTLGSVGAPIKETESNGTVTQANHRTWPVVRIGGKKRKAAISWMRDSDAADAAHSCSTLRM